MREPGEARADRGDGEQPERAPGEQVRLRVHLHEPPGEHQHEGQEGAAGHQRGGQPRDADEEPLPEDHHRHPGHAHEHRGQQQPPRVVGGEPVPAQPDQAEQDGDAGGDREADHRHIAPGGVGCGGVGVGADGHRSGPSCVLRCESLPATLRPGRARLRIGRPPSCRRRRRSTVEPWTPRSSPVRQTAPPTTTSTSAPASGSSRRTSTRTTPSSAARCCAGSTRRRPSTRPCSWATRGA